MAAPRYVLAASLVVILAVLTGATIYRSKQSVPLVTPAPALDTQTMPAAGGGEPPDSPRPSRDVSDAIVEADRIGHSIAGEREESRRMMLELDRRFHAERVDFQWASTHERAIGNAIAGHEHDGFDVPPPQAIDVECRSSLCSIRMAYADETDAANMQAKLMLGMPAELSKAITFAVPNPNGNTELQIFAGDQASVF